MTGGIKKNNQLHINTHSQRFSSIIVLTTPLPILHPPLVRGRKTHPDTFPPIKEHFNQAAERAQSLASFAMRLSQQQRLGGGWEGKAWVYIQGIRK